MKPEYHRRINMQALEKYISSAALKIINTANVGQDALRYQLGHDHFHYDNNSFAVGDTYIEEQRRAVIDALGRGEATPAWQAFGRLTHTVQDFYAHSNYVALWRERCPDVAADQIQPSLAAALSDPRLHSGRLYYPLEALSFLPGLQRLVAVFLPDNSHARMNKDDPSRPGFEFAYAAAVKRTEIEFQKIVQALTPSQVALFSGKA
jgi:hypothetical protein